MQHLKTHLQPFLQSLINLACMSLECVSKLEYPRKHEQANKLSRPQIIRRFKPTAPPCCQIIQKCLHPLGFVATSREFYGRKPTVPYSSVKNKKNQPHGGGREKIGYRQ